jgi:hypothetical protein
MTRRSKLLLAAAALLIAACSDRAPEPDPGSDAGTVTTTRVTAPPTTGPPATLPPLPALAPGETVCDRYAAPAVTGSVTPGALRETSGIAASRIHPGVLWAHNDSGDAAAFHAVGTDGADLGRFRLTGAVALDWEDMAIGPGPDPARDHLYLGDIGDNLLLRSTLTVYRVPEPTPDRAGGVVEDAEALRLTYGELGPFNAEAMLVDRVTGDLLVITKRDEDGRSVVFRAAAAELGAERIALLEPIRVLRLGSRAEVTGADITADGGLIALRGYEQVWVWPRGTPDLAAVFATEPCTAPSPSETQGEALAFAPDGGYYTIGEGSHPPIYYVAPMP